ncbi:MAG: diguanylate cyclase [Syntrophaceae bacterium]|nr:diguanylate cyclase [Syntrophaceae bacterium]
MEKLEGKFAESVELGSGRVVNRDLFLFLLDLEVKRSRRYQNFLCLMFFNIQPFSKNGNGGGLQNCYDTLTKILLEEMRESDIIGTLELNKLVVLLPYADAKAGAYVQSRFEDVMKYYDFKSKGFEIKIHQVCFPVHGTDTMDLIRKALEAETT